MTAKEEAPHSLRALFGTDGTQNAVHGSDSSLSAERELELFFGRKHPTTAIFNNCTLGLIKPHVVMKNMGSILDTILSEGFEISAMKLYTLPKGVVEEFYEVYRGILPEYHEVVEELAAGPVLALEIRQQDAVESFSKKIP